MKDADSAAVMLCDSVFFDLEFVGTEDAVGSPENVFAESEMEID